MKTPVMCVLALLEAHSITGPAKVIVELARETILNRGSDGLQVQIAIVAEEIPIEVIEEREVFDPRVLPQLRKMLARLKTDILWTHSVKSQRVISTVGRMSREKGQADLVRAFSLQRTAASESVHLIMVGEGPELDNLDTLANSLGTRDRITFAGHQADDSASLWRA